MLDFLRKQDWASAGLRRRIKSIQKAYESLETDLHHQPTEKEVAASLGITEQEVTAALQQSQMFNVVNFEAMVYEQESDSIASSEQHDPYRMMENQEIGNALRSVISTLPEKERMVIVLHYYEGLTMAAGAFVQGSSIELSADGPIRPPYAVYFQGGLTWYHAKLGILQSLQKLLDAGIVRL